MSSAHKNKAQIPNKETYSRMNFLYQASMLMAKRNRVLGAYYGQQCQMIGKKAQLKISPDLKRDLCRRCALGQRPGITSDLEISQPKKPNRRRKKKNIKCETIDEEADIVTTCRFCNYSRRFRVNPEYGFWLENPSSIAEEIVYDEANVGGKNNTNTVSKTSAENRKVKK